MAIVNGIFITVCMLTIAGSVAGSFFLAAQPVMYRYTSANFMAQLNKVVFLLFVIPFFCIGGLMDGSIRYFIEQDVMVIVEEGTWKSAAYSLRENVDFANKVTFFWLTGMALYLLAMLAAYVSFQRKIRADTREIGEGAWRTEFCAACAEKGLAPGHIRLLSTASFRRICTVGVRRPAILIPEYLLEKLGSPEINIILRHELTHIQNHDVASKMMVTVLGSISWFNPMVYALRGTLWEWMELSCDEEMLRAKGAPSPHAYIKTLLKIMEEQRGRARGLEAAAYFIQGKNIRFTKRRMKGIMREGKRRNGLAGAVILAGAFGIMIYATLLAKEMDFRVNAVFSNHVDVFRKDEVTFTRPWQDDGAGYDFIDFDAEEFEGVPLKGIGDDSSTVYEIVYADGTRGAFPESRDAEPSHEHIFQNANVKRHRKYDDGTCELLTYGGKVCTSCGMTLAGEQICIITCIPCTHGRPVGNISITRGI